MRHASVAALLFALCAPVLAGETAVATRDIAQFVPGAMRVISRVDADLTGDGVSDTAFVSINDKEFESAVTVVIRAQGKPAVETLKLDLSPHGPPTLSVRNGVLLVESTIGGNMVQTTATYRYRFDTEDRRMRLIGLDAERTAETNAIKFSQLVR
jgi:hypothetical protein